MDIAAIRAQLATVAGLAGFNAFDYQPDDPGALPAVVAGGIREMERLNRIVTRLQLVVTFYASLAEPADAARRLDLALSVGVEGSFIDLLDAVPVEGQAWRSVRFIGSGPYQTTIMPAGTGNALSCETVLEFTA